VVPWVALQVMVDGHGGSVEQGAWWQRSTERETTN
jgi:hypothetical protein